MRRLTVGGCVAVAVLLLAGCAQMFGPPPGGYKHIDTVPANPQELSVLLNQLKAGNFIDPDSIRLRNVRVAVAGGSDKKFCGEFNAKNSLGGYTGFKPINGSFNYSGGKPYLVAVGDLDTPNITAQICADGGFYY